MPATLRPFFVLLCSASCLSLGSFSPPPANAEDISEDLRIRGRLHSGWQLSAQENPDSWSDSFYLRRARIDGRWKPNDWSKLNLEFEFSNNNFRIRDAYAEFSPFKDSDLDLDFTVGHFKKPFSRLRMMSPWDLDIPERGLMNAFVANGTRFGGFGARDIGFMVSGNVKGPALFTEDPLKLQYSLGGFNSLPSETEYYRDVVGRTQLRLFKGLIVALNGSLKLYDDSGFKSAFVWGGDVKWEWDQFKWVTEAAHGDNVNTGGKLWGAHSTFSYRVPLPENWFGGLAVAPALTPAIMVEGFNPEANNVSELDWRLAAALNLDLTSQLRLVLGLEKTWENLAASDRSQLSNPTRLNLQANVAF